MDGPRLIRSPGLCNLGAPPSPGSSGASVPLSVSLPTTPQRTTRIPAAAFRQAPAAGGDLREWLRPHPEHLSADRHRTMARITDQSRELLGLMAVHGPPDPEVRTPKRCLT
jgi:hypothetical protein